MYSLAYVKLIIWNDSRTLMEHVGMPDCVKQKPTEMFNPHNNEKWIIPLCGVHVLSEMKLNLLTRTIQQHDLMMQQLQGNKSVEMLTRCINKKDYPANTTVVVLSGYGWFSWLARPGSIL